jgi:hypothetical protein
VLAGVGQVTLAADGPAAAHAGGNFLIPTAAAAPADNEPATAAAVAARTLQEMNPLVRVVALPGGEAAVDQAAAMSADQTNDPIVAGHDLVVWCGAPTSLWRAQQVGSACRARGSLFMAAATSGHAGFCFCDFGAEYTYRPKENEQQQQQQAGGGGSKKKEDAPSAAAAAPEQTVAFSPLSAALAAPLGGLHANAHPLFPVLCAIAAVQRRAAEEQAAAATAPPPPPSGEAGALAVARELEAGTLGSSPGGKELLAAAVDLARAYVGQAAGGAEDADAAVRSVMREYAPVAAVVGATAANAALRAVSRSGHPLRNAFFYSCADGRGLVEDQPAMAEALAQSGGKAGGSGAAAGGAAAQKATAAEEVVLD